MNGPLSTEDARDIPLAANGDEAAARRLYERYAADVARQMWRFTRDPVIHQDLAQDVWISAFRNLREFRGEAPFPHWIRRIATHTGYRFWKRQARDLERRRAYEAEQHTTAAPANPETPVEAAEQLHALLALLPPDQRLVLTLFYLEECGVSEIADRTGWSASKVKVCNMRARQRMKTLLEEHGYERTS
ncbi:MAG: RNA polymerase sigma factor [Candidatus Hydrogenedentes bacterium]|nr:RNA polymerase sigma factor [Candidatus Hydrogenedentota bacterium]